MYKLSQIKLLKAADNKKLVLDYTMDELEDMPNPVKYFSPSRSFYVSIKSIEMIDNYFGKRLILQLKPAVDKEVLVNSEKVIDFRK